MASTGIAGFRALATVEASKVVAKGSKSGFTIEASGQTLATENGKTRVFKNLTTLARFAKAEGCGSISVDLTLFPKKKTPKAKTAAAAATSTGSSTPVAVPKSKTTAAA